MAGFKYQAMDATGKLKKGVLEVDSLRQARANLREDGLIPLEVEALVQQEQKPGMRRSAFSRRKISSSELSLMTRQFATLIGSGLTVEQTMNALIEQAEGEQQRQILAGIRGEVLAGNTLSASMGQYPHVFPELYRTLVRAGEQSGQLSEVLSRLADYTEESQALRQKVTLAFVYPGIISLVAVAVITGLLTYVVPQVVEVFRNTNQTLPLLTRLLIGLSDFLRTTGIFWLIALAIGVWLFSRAMRAEAFRLSVHRFLLRVPVVGRLIRCINTARLASTLAILTGSRVPLLNALQAGVGVMNNLPMKNALEEAQRMVREGAPLSRSLGVSKMFPPVMVHLIASGEASGKLDTMLERVATQQTREIENRVSTLTALLEPILILTMGVMVLIIVLAILLPIFELNQLVK
ncbi:MAG: type II secretion system inner membrane protein GspF [Burkholderiales bacterium]